MNQFREITIPGDVLEDESLSDGAKILYGKISRLSYKEGNCWASNSFLDGTKSGRNACRFISELRRAGYIIVLNQQGKNRKIVLRPVENKINSANSGEVMNGSPANSGDDEDGSLANSSGPTSPNIESTSPNLAANLAKFGERTSLKTNIKNKEKEQGDDFSFPNFHGNPQEEKPPDSLPNQPSKSKEDATSVFQKARNLCNELKVLPECRDLIIPPSEYDCLRTFQNYTWNEIENAIRNFDWHKKGICGPGFARPPPFKSIYGFLKTGVAQYFNDETVIELFKEEVHNGVKR